MASSSSAVKVHGAGLGGRQSLLPTRRRRVSSCWRPPGGDKFGRRPMPEVAWRNRTRRAPQLAMASGNDSTASMLSLTDELPAPRRRVAVTPEEVDRWMAESIGDIVRDIDEAPFLVNIFSGIQGAHAGVRLERDGAATPEGWAGIKKRWDEEGGTPDAVILVEQLGDRAAAVWGLVVQGRGMDCAACYILNTTRVKSSMGFCTHFCLVRAKCYGEAADVQLVNTWLQ